MIELVRDPEAELTQERLKEVIDYDPATGWFTWRAAQRRRRRQIIKRVGQRAGGNSIRGAASAAGGAHDRPERNGRGIRSSGQWHTRSCFRLALLAARPGRGDDLPLRSGCTAEGRTALAVLRGRTRSIDQEATQFRFSDNPVIPNHL